MLHQRLRATLRRTWTAAASAAFFPPSCCRPHRLWRRARPPTAAHGRLQKVYRTNAPGGIFGFWGADVSSSQKVASRFTMDGSADLQLARIGLHLMNNRRR